MNASIVQVRYPVLNVVGLLRVTGRRGYLLWKLSGERVDGYRLKTGGTTWPIFPISVTCWRVLGIDENMKAYTRIRRSGEHSALVGCNHNAVSLLAIVLQPASRSLQPRPYSRYSRSTA